MIILYSDSTHENDQNLSFGHFLSLKLFIFLLLHDWLFCYSAPDSHKSYIIHVFSSPRACRSLQCMLQNCPTPWLLWSHVESQWHVPLFRPGRMKPPWVRLITGFCHCTGIHWHTPSGEMDRILWKTVTFNCPLPSHSPMTIHKTSEELFQLAFRSCTNCVLRKTATLQNNNTVTLL